MRNIDLSTLRAFVTVAETGGVTRASGFLNLTQSAVSMQLKRLEQMLGVPLLERAGRNIALTPHGEQLLSYAKRMVSLNDEIFTRLTDQAFEGEITLGVPHDIIYPVIPQVLQRFHAEFPRVRVNLTSSYTGVLHRDFARGALDMILTTETETRPGAEILADVPLRWVGAPNGSAWRQRPLRLAFSKNCGFRKSVVATLDKAGIEWEMGVESESDRTIEATVSADLAVTAMLEGHAPPQLSDIDCGEALPDLSMFRINMYASAVRPELIEALQMMTRQGFRSRA